MAAPQGNQFWKVRSKHGRNRIIESPEILEEAANEYFQWCVDNPIIQNDFKGQHAEEVEIKLPRVFTKEGLAIFCGLHAYTVISDLKAVSKDFSEVVSKIEAVIYNQKFSNASVGLFNASIISRDLGLKEQTQTDLTSGGEPFTLEIKPK